MVRQTASNIALNSVLAEVSREKAALRAEISRLREANERLREAARKLVDAIVDTEEHGEGAAEEGCPICDAIDAVVSLSSETNND